MRSDGPGNSDRASVAAARRTGAGKLAISVADQGPGLRFEQVAGGKQGGNLDRRAGRRPGGVDDHQPALAGDHLAVAAPGGYSVGSYHVLQHAHESLSFTWPRSRGP
jgi:hypothetical protein